MQALTQAFPAVSFAAVAIKGERKPLLALMRKRGLTRVQVGFDRDGVLAGLYKMASCPQVSFVLPGGVVQSPALLKTPSTQVLRARVGELAVAAGGAGVAGVRTSPAGAAAPATAPPPPPVGRASGSRGG
jgi:hypothetical protein